MDKMIKKYASIAMAVILLLCAALPQVTAKNGLDEQIVIISPFDNRDPHRGGQN